MGSDRGRRLEVAQAIAHAGRLMKRNVEALGEGEEHSRTGLAAGRLSLGRVGAIEPRLDASARLVHRLVHLGVDGIQAWHVAETAADPRLVRCDRDGSPGWRDAGA